MPHANEDYVLDDQIGFVLRQAQQRHTTLFAAEMIEGLTTTQWAALAKLRECGACSQNHLGRLTAMDAADRMIKREGECQGADYDITRDNWRGICHHRWDGSIVSCSSFLGSAVSGTGPSMQERMSP